MQDEIKKVGYLTLYDDPYEKSVSDSDIVFYNLDINTAVLEFTISKNNFPLQISDENVDTYVYLQGTDQNGNKYGRQLDVEYIDPFKGLVRLTVPDDYLKAVNGSIVTGQMYIGVHKENRVPETKADTAVLNEFKFTVKDALINSVSAVTKIEYIRMFDKLKDEIKQRVKDIEDAIANGSDYVAQMKNVLADGLKQINTTVTQAKKDVNDTATSANSSVNSTKDNAIKTINDTTASNLNASNKAKQDVLDAISNAKLISKDTYDSNNTALNKAITDGDTKAIGDAKTYVDGKDWQKYKLTNDDGTLTSVSGLDLGSVTVLNSLKPGMYYGYNFINAPVPAGFLEVVSRADNTIKRIELKPYNTKDTYVMTYTNSTWSSWQLMNAQPTFSDTGWVPLTLLNGATANTEFTTKNGFVCAYKVVVNNRITTNYLRLNGRNLTPGQVLAQLPSSMVKNLQTFTPKTPNSTSGGNVIINTDGTVVFYNNYTSSATTWSADSYIYGEFNWTN